MKRLKDFSLAFIVLVLISCAPNRTILRANHEKSKSFVFAVWGEGDAAKSAAAWDSIFTKFKNAGITDFFMQASPSELSRLVDITKNKGLKIHGWIMVLNRPNDTIAQQHPDWYAVNRNGQNSLDYRAYVDYYQWLSPFSPGAREYIKSNIRAIAEVKGLASVHLDYVRYCDVILGAALQPKYNIVQNYEMPEYDYDYHPLARKGFEEIFGVDPIKMEHPELSNEWRQYRLNAVTSLVNELSEIAHQNHKRLSAAVFPFPEMSRMMVKQDWSSWKLDLVLPMLYHNFYNQNINWIGFSMEQAVKEVDGRFPIYAGLFIPSLSPEELKEAILISKKANAAGVSFFEMNSLNEEHLKIIKLLDKSFNP